MNGKKDSWLKIIWRLFYPLMIYSGITLLLQFIVCFAMTMRAVANAGYANLMTDTEQLMMLMNQVLESYMSIAYYMTVLGAILTAPILYLLYKNDKKKRMGLGTEIAYRHATVLEYVLIGLVACGACIGGNNLIMGSGLIEIDESYQQVSEILYSAPIWVQLMGTGILIPFCEELIFRGLMYNRMKEYMPVGTAIMMSAVAFGLYHGNLVQMIYAIALGYLMAYVYERYHSFLAPFVFHAAANMLSVLISETGFFDFMYTGKVMMLISGAMGIIIVVMGIRIIEERVKLEPEDPASKVEL